MNNSALGESNSFLAIGMLRIDYSCDSIAKKGSKKV